MRFTVQQRVLSLRAFALAGVALAAVLSAATLIGYRNVAFAAAIATIILYGTAYGLIAGRLYRSGSA